MEQRAAIRLLRGRKPHENRNNGTLFPCGTSRGNEEKSRIVKHSRNTTEEEEEVSGVIKREKMNIFLICLAGCDVLFLKE